MKQFNTTGLCIPEEHYMVDISQRLKEIKAMVDAGMYFCINRGRQYGKTTTLEALAGYLADEYFVFSLDFQGLGSGVFQSEGTFTQGLARLMIYKYELAGIPIPQKYVDECCEINRKQAVEVGMDEIFFLFQRWCKESEKGIVLMIDEVDSATNNQVFLDFLAQLRNGYLNLKVV